MLGVSPVWRLQVFGPRADQFRFCRFYIQILEIICSDFADTCSDSEDLGSDIED